MKDPLVEDERAIETEIIGHDNDVYQISKVYTGSNFIHIAKAPMGTLAGSSRIKDITFHIDDLDKVISALQKLKYR